MRILNGLAKKILLLGYAVLFVLIVCACFIGFIYPDIWWQLKEGYSILYNLKLPQTPLNAFGFASTTFPHEYVFYEVLIASIRRVLGFLGLRAFFFILAFFPFGYALMWIIKKRQWNFGNFYILVFIYFMLILRIQQRPEILANAFFIIILHLLVTRDFRASPYFLIMFFWVNTHASFIIGLGAIALWIANDIWLNKRKNLSQLLKVGLAGLFGGILHPSGIFYLLEPFKLQSAIWSKLTSSEMLPITGYGYIFVALALIPFSIIIWKAGWRPYFWLILLFVGSIILSLQSQRYVNLVGCILCVIAFMNTRENNAFKKTNSVLDLALTGGVLIPALIILGIVLLPAIGRNFFKEKYIQRFADRIIKSLPDENKKILSEIRAGSYINGVTENFRPFLDTGFNRFSQDNLRYLYYLDNAPEALFDVLNRLRVDYVIVTKFNHHWNLLLSEHPKWKVAMVEPESILYVPQEESEIDLNKRLIVWDEKNLKFYEPKRRLVYETLRMVNTGVYWREGKFYSFFDWWLQKQNPEYIENFLRDSAEIQPTLELVLLEKLGKLELTKLSNKKYRATDPFSKFVRAQILFQHGNLEYARQELQDIHRRQIFSAWEAEMLKNLFPKFKDAHLLWNEENQKWFFNFTDKLNQN